MSLPAIGLLILPTELNCPHKNAAQIISLGILVLIFDWPHDVLLWASRTRVLDLSKGSAGVTWFPEFPGARINPIHSVHDAFKLQWKYIYYTLTFKSKDLTLNLARTAANTMKKSSAHSESHRPTCLQSLSAHLLNLYSSSVALS